MTDVNGVRHHLIYGPRDWAWGEYALDDPQRPWTYDAEEQAVTLTPSPFVFPQPRGDALLQIEQRRGAGRDRFGHWYFIGEDETEVRVRWSAASRAVHYWSAADPEPALESDSPFTPATVEQRAPERLAGLAVTKSHYLIVGSGENPELLVFDLFTGGAQPMRISLPAPAGETEQPAAFDIAATDDGGVLVLDRAHHWVWRLHGGLGLQPAAETPGEPLLFQPSAGGEERLAPPTETSAPVVLAEAVDPVSIEPLPDGSFLVLDVDDAGASMVRRYDATGAVLGAAVLEPMSLMAASSGLQAVRAHDMALVPGPGGGPPALYVVDVGGNQAYRFDVSLGPAFELRIGHRYFPLRAFGGKALVTPWGESHAYFDRGDEWQRIVGIDRVRYATDATLDTRVLDGHEPACVWHRVCIDACIPPGTSVEVMSRTAEDETSLLAAPWLEEPVPYRRGDGPELPYYGLWAPEECSREHTGTFELLLQRAEGRFLQLRLRLRGNQRSTPAIRALRAHYPRFSYLKRYLPAVYQDDPVSASFLNRFLANPEGLLTTIEGLVANVQTMFDARTAPREAVGWLAAWVGLLLDPTWSDYQRRLMLAHAPRFYQRRGTITGLAWLLRVATDELPAPAIFDEEWDSRCSSVRLVERFRTRRAPGVVAGDATDAATPEGSVMSIARERAHRFTVLLSSRVSDDKFALVERLVMTAKPAHTWVAVKRFHDMFRIGEVRLGYDTRVDEGGRFAAFLLGSTGLAEGALGAAFPETVTDRTVIAG